MREQDGLDAIPYQWATSGYMGAIQSSKTICGVLFGGTAFLGFLYGKSASDAPEVKDEARRGAIKSVRNMFNGFRDVFGDTDCKTLTSIDWSNKEDVNRYYQEKIYDGKCYEYFKYTLKYCLDQLSSE